MAVKPIPSTEDSSYPNNLEFVPPLWQWGSLLLFPRDSIVPFLPSLMFIIKGRIENPQGHAKAFCSTEKKSLACALFWIAIYPIP